jgi:hypothetical protein
MGCRGVKHPKAWCRICQAEAVYVAVLHDGARIPYCQKHLPDWQALDHKTFDELIKALLKVCREK